MNIKFTGKKTAKVKKLISDLLDILQMVGIPMAGLTDRRKERMAMACLAVGNITKTFAEATSAESGTFLKTRDIIDFENKNFSENISSGSYDDIRRQDLIYLVEAAIVVNSSGFSVQATNDPSRGYALSVPFTNLLHSFGHKDWSQKLKSYVASQNKLKDELQGKRELEEIPVTLPSGDEYRLSPGKHNELQKAIIEKFLPVFGMGSRVLYLGDTSDKFLFRDDASLQELNFFELKHDALPDIVAYSEEKNLLFLVEAVHSSGPMSELRVKKLKRQLEKCPAKIVFFTAFLTKNDFKKWLDKIAWETEVWIAEAPEHLVHFNGYKFLEVNK